MTRTRFGFAVIFQTFGLLRKTKRMTDAAFEAHLMQDGEELLGKYCWKNIENIENLSMEYWNIRRLEREQKEIQEKNRRCRTNSRKCPRTSRRIC